MTTDKERIRLLEDTLRQAQILLKKQKEASGGGKEMFDDCVRRKMNSGTIDNVALKQCQDDPNVLESTKSGIGWTTANGVTKHASVAKKLLTLQNHYDGTINEIPSPIKNASTDTYPAWLKTHDYFFQEYNPEPKEDNRRSAAAIEDNRPHFIRTMDHTEERRRRNW